MVDNHLMGVAGRHIRHSRRDRSRLPRCFHPHHPGDVRRYDLRLSGLLAETGAQRKGTTRTTSVSEITRTLIPLCIPLPSPGDFVLRSPRASVHLFDVINRATGVVSFQSGLHISPHCSVQSLRAQNQDLKIESRNLSLKGWRRHILGFHPSDHGTFEVEALSAEAERVYLVLLSHSHSFYEKGTPDDAERRAFHEGIISSDLAGQKEFTWGDVRCRLETISNQDWLVIAYSRDANVPFPEQDVISRLFAHEKMPEDNT